MATEQAVSAVIVATRPKLNNDADKVAFAVHASFLSAGYLLHATGAPAFTDDALTATSSVGEVGIEGWNEFGEYYAFVYSKPEKGSSKKVLVKCLVANNTLIVDALRDGASDPLHLELNIGDFVVESHATNYSSLFKNLGGLVERVNKEVLTKLTGSSTSSSSTEPKSSERREDLRDDRRQPDVMVSEPQGPPYHPYNPSGLVVPPVYPSTGFDDLNPGPGAGMFPSRTDFGRGGMLVGPNDPRFFGGRIGDPGFQGGPPGVPPGARFDPYGPPNVPGFEPNRFVRNPRGPGGGTHPDLEHFRDGSDFI